MKKLLVCLLLITLYSQAVRMPTATILNERLGEKGYAHFAEKTSIVNDLAGKELEPLDVSVAFNHASCEYSKYVNSSLAARAMERLKPKILELLLQDYPQEFAVLKKQLEDAEKRLSGIKS